jgi:hypothetical protein
MKVRRCNSFVSGLHFFLILLFAVDPSFPAFYAARIASQHENNLFSPQHALETLAVSLGCNKKDVSKPTAIGLFGNCQASVQLPETEFAHRNIETYHDVLVLSYSRSRSPPPLLPVAA